MKGTNLGELYDWGNAVMYLSMALEGATYFKIQLLFSDAVNGVVQGVRKAGVHARGTAGGCSKADDEGSQQVCSTGQSKLFFFSGPGEPTTPELHALHLLSLPLAVSFLRWQ